MSTAAPAGRAAQAAQARRASLASQLGVSERLFSSPAERRFAKRVEEGLDQVEEGLMNEVRFADELADVTTRYLLEAGGKRVRPMLTMLAAQLGDGPTPEVVTAAMAIEITHLASLYHDDVMDEAMLRRGVPSAQSVWGNSVAVLTGDLLFARASRLIAALGERAITLQSDTFERLCLGQLHETIGPREGDDPIDHYIQVLSDKTGSLIATAAQFGVVFSSAPDEFEQPVVEFGEKVGIAFQLIDDVIDLSSDGDTGKVAGTDLRAGVATLPLLKLRVAAESDDASARLLAALEREVIGVPEAEGQTDAAAAAIAELRAHAATADTRAEAHRWAREAVEAIAPLPEGPATKAMRRFAETIVERSH
ncbi:polyprenyl synthetase family protein [Microbacterium sp. STN6]|uniref:polyprenyl synthetase family protein n=1 Tax=Microbacterium sp. STN6 TaxID=2995588 RepID=UPI002260C0E0|nr:polyprenyl synthetase family protein [Microbacterium sp. STN6]MCX7520693.1 polyprenyl synthetase family protein [Microbacterium sp. STN6]